MPVNNSISFWDYLNNNAGAIQAVSTVILAIITGIYVFLTGWLARVSKSQLQFQKESEEYKIQQDIIAVALKFIFRLDDELYTLYLMRRDYIGDGTLYFSDSKEKPIGDFIMEVMRYITDKKIMQELKYITFQVKRLKNKDLWKDLDQIENIFDEMVDVLMKVEDIREYYKIQDKYKKQKEDFVDKCLAICEVGSVQ
jgi:hypothetical protein